MSLDYDEIEDIGPSMSGISVLNWVRAETTRKNVVTLKKLTNQIELFANDARKPSE